MKKDIRSDLAVNYIKDYRKKSKKYLLKFINSHILKASEISKIPAEKIKRFKELSMGGKRVRGTLVKLGYEIAGGKNQRSILDASVFIEMFHTGLLIHDDIIDQDDLRRGVVNIHKQFEEIGKALKVKPDPAHFGRSIAICAGDMAFYLSWEKLINSKFSKDKILKAANIYCNYAIRVVYGEDLDIANTSMGSISEKDILKVFQLKTAEYTGVLPLLVGATLGGTKDKKRMSLLKKYGLFLGWVFQIQDDILGLFSKTETLGKPVGSDLSEGKNTFLMLHLYKNGKQKDIKFVRSLVGKNKISKGEVERVRKILVDTGSLEYTKKLGWDYVEKGIKLADKITTNKKQQKLLKSFIYFMMERTL